jgi:hypothetical protein
LVTEVEVREGGGILCCLSTGLGFGTRQHYTHYDEALYEALRPVMFTSIVDAVDKGTVMGPAVLLLLP